MDDETTDEVLADAAPPVTVGGGCGVDDRAGGMDGRQAVKIGDYTVIGPLCYQGKEDCVDPRCRRMLYQDEPRIRPGCLGYHCSYCDEPCSMMGHRCDAADAVLGEARRVADEVEERGA